jgi:hypothetical protein
MLADYYSLTSYNNNQLFQASKAHSYKIPKRLTILHIGTSVSYAYIAVIVFLLNSI